MTISSISSVAVVGISISGPLAIVSVVTISAIAIASVATMAVVSVARLGSSFWLSNSSCLGLPLAIVAVVSIPAVAISTIAIARLSSSGSLPLAIIAMTVAMAIPALCDNHSEEGEGKKDQKFHGVLSSS